MKDWILATFFPATVEKIESLEREIRISLGRDLERQLAHAQKLNLSLAEKITMRPVIQPVVPDPAEKQTGKRIGGHVGWVQTRNKLEQQDAAQT